MDKILVEALEAFPYSPNGWDSARTIVGQEIYLTEGAVEGLLALDPPFVKLVDENFKPVVFSSEKELMEKEIEKEKEEIPEVPIEALLGEAEVDVEVGEEITLDSLKAIVEEAPKGADEIDLGEYKAVQKSGNWYNVFKKDEDEKINDTGIARKALAKFVYELKEA